MRSRQAEVLEKTREKRGGGGRRMEQARYVTEGISYRAVQLLLDVGKKGHSLKGM